VPDALCPPMLEVRQSTQQLRAQHKKLQLEIPLCSRIDSFTASYGRGSLWGRLNNLREEVDERKMKSLTK
jgi:hypothetical protein